MILIQKIIIDFDQKLEVPQAMSKEKKNNKNSQNNNNNNNSKNNNNQ